MSLACEEFEACVRSRVADALQWLELNQGSDPSGARDFGALDPWSDSLSLRLKIVQKSPHNMVFGFKKPKTYESLEP